MTALAGFLRSTAGAAVVTVLLVILASLPVSFGFVQTNLGGEAVIVAAAGLCFLLVPWLLTRLVLKERLSTFGWRTPVISRRTIVLWAGVFAAHVAAIVALSTVPDLRTSYSLEKSLGVFLSFFGPLSLLYYACEEFLFRGWFFGLVKHRGRALAYGANAVLFGVLHLPKSLPEAVFAGGMALLLCWLAEETRSIFPGVLMHWIIALVLLVLVNTQW